MTTRTVVALAPDLAAWAAAVLQQAQDAIASRRMALFAFDGETTGTGDDGRVPAADRPDGPLFTTD